MWQGIQGHDAVVERFRRAAARGRIAGTYLFVGPEGIGKRLLAVQLAKAILCSSSGEAGALDACDTCQSCRLVNGGAHPDLEIVAKRTDRQEFTIDILIGDREHRNQEGLLHRIALKPALGSRKVGIIDDADRFNPECSNALLKTLEEPPPGAIIFLIGTSQQRQYPTIRSRSQIVRFTRLPQPTVTEFLIAHRVVTNRDVAYQLAAASGGSIAAACRLADESLFDFRNQLLGWISRPVIDRRNTSCEVARFVDAAGKEAKDRRNRLRQVIGFAIDFYRDIVRSECGRALQGDSHVRNAVERSMENRSELSVVEPECSLDRLESCLDALARIDRNVNLPTLIDWWVDEMART